MANVSSAGRPALLYRILGNQLVWYLRNEDHWESFSRKFGDQEWFPELRRLRLEDISGANVVFPRGASIAHVEPAAQVQAGISGEATKKGEPNG